MVAVVLMDTISRLKEHCSRIPFNSSKSQYSDDLQLNKDSFLHS